MRIRVGAGQFWQFWDGIQGDSHRQHGRHEARLFSTGYGNESLWDKRAVWGNQSFHHLSIRWQWCLWWWAIYSYCCWRTSEGSVVCAGYLTACVSSNRDKREGATYWCLVSSGGELATVDMEGSKRSSRKSHLRNWDTGTLENTGVLEHSQPSPGLSHGFPL